MIPGLHRGSIWIADFPPPWKRRPVVVITRDIAIPHLTNVTAVIVARSARGLHTEVPLGPEQGLDQKCVASCDNILTMEIDILKRRVGELGAAKVQELNDALRIALGL
jgi:mRNA interferase MazF